MSQWMPQSYQDFILNSISASDEQCVCSAQPTTYYQACKGSLWLADHVYSQGDVVHPPTYGGYVYECTVGGTSGSSEPSWGTVDNETFSDNGVTWKTHINYSLINTALVSGDFSITDESTDRVLNIAQHIGVVTHRSGTITHTAYILSTDKSLRFVTTSHTTLSENDDVVAGRTTIIFAMKIRVKQPTIS